MNYFFNTTFNIFSFKLIFLFLIIHIEKKTVVLFQYREDQSLCRWEEAIQIDLQKFYKPVFCFLANCSLVCDMLCCEDCS